MRADRSKTCFLQVREFIIITTITILHEWISTVQFYFPYMYVRKTDKRQKMESKNLLPGHSQTARQERLYILVLQ